MADPGIFGTITDALGSAYDYVKYNDPTGVIKTIDGVLSAPNYPFKYNVFPEDLGSEYMPHYILMKFYVKSYSAQPNYGLISNGFGQNAYNVALYLPSMTGGGLFPKFQDTHEYTDIHMTNLFLNQLGTAGKAIRAAGATTGRAINPGVQVLYKTTHLRKFEFSFLFAPRSENESKNMEEIIKNIRFFSAPIDQGLYFGSPAEVEISFHFNGKENPHIIKMKRQVVTFTEVDYAPDQAFSTFTNGYPVSCQFTMATREMEIIDQKDVGDGY